MTHNANNEWLSVRYVIFKGIRAFDKSSVNNITHANLNKNATVHHTTVVTVVW